MTEQKQYNKAMPVKIQPRIWRSLSREKKERIFKRTEREFEVFSKIVRPILKKVMKSGDSALLECSKKFEKVEYKTPQQFKVKPSDFEKAEAMLSKDMKKAIRLAYQNVYNYHLASRTPKKRPLTENGQGVFIGTRATPVDSVALYIPRGKGCFPSMVYMLGVPALIAEVPRVVMVTPPFPDGTLDPACLYAADLCKIHEIYKVGGAHAIAALAYGTKTISPVNKIIGPGSMLVSTAKQLVRPRVDVGLPAGPSESLIIADGTTPADLVAHDLCIEAEHGQDSMAILLTHKRDYAESVAKHLNKLLAEAPDPQKKILGAVFTTYTSIVVAESLQESIAISNAVAPEHLLLHSEWTSKILSKITNAGEILLGKYSPFSLANYMAGANAVLPTGGMAKSYSAVSVQDLIKEISVIQITPRGYEKLSPLVQTLAEYEGFHFHKKALEYRDMESNTKKHTDKESNRSSGI